MSKIGSQLQEMNHIGALANRDQAVNRLHPLVKFVLTLGYIALVVSFPKYDLGGVVSMLVYPLAGFILAELSWRDSLRRLRVVLPLVCIVGIFNPFFDTAPARLLGWPVNAGVISMLTLMSKGVLTVLASYLLIATTTIEKIGYALRLLHIPRVLVTQLLLTYRYLTLLLAEAQRMTQAYSLRAPRQRGVHFRVWGSLLGQLLLRSMDRAGTVYDSMTLRGYTGEFNYFSEQLKIRRRDLLWLAGWLLLLGVFRAVPVFALIGSLFGGI